MTNWPGKIQRKKHILWYLWHINNGLHFYQSLSGPSISPSTHPFTHLSTHLSHPPSHASTFPSFHPSTHSSNSSIHPTTHTFIQPLIRPSIYPSFHSSSYPSFCLLKFPLTDLLFFMAKNLNTGLVFLVTLLQMHTSIVALWPWPCPYSHESNKQDAKSYCPDQLLLKLFLSR